MTKKIEQRNFYPVLAMDGQFIRLKVRKKMIKKDFCEVLEAALLSFDGVNYETLTKIYLIAPEAARLGIMLCSYIKNNYKSQESQQNL